VLERISCAPCASARRRPPSRAARRRTGPSATGNGPAFSVGSPTTPVSQVSVGIEHHERNPIPPVVGHVIAGRSEPRDRHAPREARRASQRNDPHQRARSSKEPQRSAYVSPAVGDAHQARDAQTRTHGPRGMRPPRVAWVSWRGEVVSKPTPGLLENGRGGPRASPGGVTTGTTTRGEALTVPWRPSFLHGPRVVLQSRRRRPDVLAGHRYLDCRGMTGGYLARPPAWMVSTPQRCPPDSPSPTPVATRFSSPAIIRAVKLRTTSPGSTAGTSAFTIGTGAGTVERHPSITANGVLSPKNLRPATREPDVQKTNTVGYATNDSNVNTTATRPSLHPLDGARLAFVRDTPLHQAHSVVRHAGQRFIPLPARGAAGTNDRAPALDQQGQRIVCLRPPGKPDIFLHPPHHTRWSFGPLASTADIEPLGSRKRRGVSFASLDLGLGGYDVLLFSTLTATQLVVPGQLRCQHRDP
jgi:hypothetical protein